jgi:ABC-type transporter Mla maintaining outer membrane lipid asymmetry ATPase subunit MlaF
LPGEPLLEIAGVSKQYGGLRPLRIDRFSLVEGQRIALMGFDHVAAEVFVNLVTGATLPDAGSVRVLGQITSEIQDAGSWLETVDRFGLLSERSVLVDQLSAWQNLALRHTFELDALTPELQARLDRLALEVALGGDARDRPVGALSPVDRLRVRLGRALALDPRVLLAEHPNAVLPPGEVALFAADLSRIVAQRSVASIVLTADAAFANAVAEQVLTLDAATGELRPARRWRRWFS